MVARYVVTRMCGRLEFLVRDWAHFDENWSLTRCIEEMDHGVSCVSCVSCLSCVSDHSVSCVSDHGVSPAVGVL